MIENPNRCSYKGCDALGTHRVVLVLANEAATLVKKFELVNADRTPTRRCLAHQAEGKHESGEFITSEDQWRFLAERFARSSVGVVGHVAIACRGNTTVHFVDDNVNVAEIPVMVPAHGAPGGLDQVGTTRILS